MILATLMWSMAGVVTRHLHGAGSFEATFWRSFFNAVALAFLLGWLRGRAAFFATLRSGGRTLWLSGVCWSVMFTAFMVAITMTTVANVLVTIASAPLLTALIARATLGQRLPARTWIAVLVAGIGIAWMFANEVSEAGPRQLVGIAVAAAVPIAAAVNWVVVQRSGRAGGDLLPAVWIGAVLCCVATFVPALPLATSRHDLALLALLGVFQLAIPCLVAVAAARMLSAPEASLLSLLEIVFGVTWTWIGAAEAPAPHVLVGGVLVIGALLANESRALRHSR